MNNNLNDDKKNIQNQVKIDDFPIDIQKFIEVVNIQFLKNKFNQQNNVTKGNSQTREHLCNAIGQNGSIVKLVTCTKI